MFRPGCSYSVAPKETFEQPSVMMFLHKKLGTFGGLASGFGWPFRSRTKGLGRELSAHPVSPN